MTEYTMAQARSHLPRLIREALAGDVVTIARDHQPLVRLVPLGTGEMDIDRVPGDLRGKLTLPHDFFGALTTNEIAEWEL